MILLVSAAAALAGCAESDPANGVFNDPHEAINRQWHETNIALDQNLVKPLTETYVAVTPQGARTAIGNFAANLSEPRYAINHLLQGNAAGFFTTIGRFTINSTVGLAGLADPASEIGMYQKPVTFGETMGVWGVKEGAYTVLPVYGPSTERDAAGRVVDFLLDPVIMFFPRAELNVATGTWLVDGLNWRHDFDSTVNSVLYDSEDSYARARLLYLQSGHGTAGAETDLGDLEDLYAE